MLDLNHNLGAPGTAPVAGEVRGGEQTITTLGLSWTPNQAVRFLLNYSDVKIDRLDPENTSIVTAVPGVGAQVGQDFQSLILRTQFSF